MSADGPIAVDAAGGDKQRGESVKVGLFARGKKTFLSAKPVVAGVGELRRIRDLADIRTVLELDLLIVEVDLKSAENIHSLKACRDSNPGLPIIMMAYAADPDVAVEVCGILEMDFLAAPHDTDEELRLKCDRGLFGRSGPTLQRPFLAPLLPEGSGMGMERRKVFRAGVPSCWASTARVVGLEPPVLVHLEDLSIPYEGKPGGMLFRAGRAEAQAIAKSVETWEKGTRLDLILDLASEKGEIPVACLVVRIPKPRSKDFFHFATEYEVSSGRHDAALMRFWTNCQMQARRKDKAGTGRSR